MLALSHDGLPEGMPTDHGILTLGWDVLGWAQDFLAQPDGEHAGEAWRWTDTQARIVAWWYAVDADGHWLYRRGQIVLPKGAGKSPLAAALSCCELAGPVVFDGTDAYGDAVGRPHPSPHVQLAAVSQDQTDNTMSLVLTMLRDGKAATEIPGLDLGLTRVRTRSGTLRPVTASAPSREGQRLTAAILDEPHLWTESNHGVRLAATLRRNLGKMGGRSIETTNCWIPGEDSVAESTALYADKIAEGNAADVGLLRYHPQASVRDLSDEAELRSALKTLYADSPWINIDRLVSEVQDLGTHPADSRRFYLNQVVTAADSLVSSEEWDATESAGELADGDTVVLGFDGSKTDDSTALVAIRMSDHLVEPIMVWEKPAGPEGKSWEVDRTDVDGVVRNTFARFDVVAAFCDVQHFESYVDQWSVDFGHKLLCKASTKSPCAWDMRGRLRESTAANERLVAEVAEGAFPHADSRTLRRHVLNTRRRLNQYGVSFGKENRESPKKIDAYAAMLLADMAYHTVANSNEWQKKLRRATGRGRVVVFT